MALDNDAQPVVVARDQLNRSAATRLSLEAYIGWFVQICINDDWRGDNTGCSRGWLVGTDHDVVVLVGLDNGYRITTHHAIQGMSAMDRKPTQEEINTATLHVPELLSLWAKRGVIT